MFYILCVLYLLDWILSKFGSKIIYYFNKLHQLKLKIFRFKQINIVVTGSYGKTTTCDLLYHILKKNFKTKLVKHNSQIGIPISLMGMNVDFWKKINNKKLKWYYLYLKLFINLFVYWPNNIINIIEVGIDSKGDMDKQLLNLPEYQISIITSIDFVHFSNFKCIEDIATEKIKLIQNTYKGGLIIYNNDNVIINKHISNIFFCKKIGVSTQNIIDNNILKITKIISNINSLDIKFKLDNKTDYLQIKNNDIFLPEYLSYNFGYILIICKYLGLKVNSSDFDNLKIQNGRCNILKGINNCQIIDSSYNSSYRPLALMINQFNKINLEHKILILGDMLELGNKEYEYHQNILNKISKRTYNKVFLIGLTFFKLRNYYTKYYFFRNVDELIYFLSTNAIKDSIILIKGSNCIKLKKVIEYLKK